MINNILKSFHSRKSFMQYGLKQASTWLGLFIFVCVFNKDVLVLVHNVLTNANLAEKIAAGLSGLVMVFFNRISKE